MAMKQSMNHPLTTTEGTLPPGQLIKRTRQHQASLDWQSQHAQNDNKQKQIKQTDSHDKTFTNDKDKEYLD